MKIWNNEFDKLFIMQTWKLDYGIGFWNKKLLNYKILKLMYQKFSNLILYIDLECDFNKKSFIDDLNQLQ